MFEQLKDTKKILEKIKKVCSNMSKFNINSPCLLQFVRINGDIEVILTHNPTNGDRFDFYKIFSTTTKDNFIINEEDQSCFEFNNDKVSVPIIISTFDFINKNFVVGNDLNSNMIYYSKLKYDCCIDSFYIFPKFVLKAIKEEIITGFETEYYRTYERITTFRLNIKLADFNNYYEYKLFIPNSDKLNYLYNLYILPFGNKNTALKDLYYNYNTNCVSYIKLNGKEWEDIYNKNRCFSAVSLKGANNQDILVYHNDFMQKKIIDATITKHYASDKGNIVTLYFDVTLNGNIHEYFSYKYYEVGGYNV